MLGAQPDPKLETSNYRSPHLQSTVSQPVVRKPLSKYHLLQPYFEDNYSAEGSSHIALEIERCIKQTRNFQKETPIFVSLIRSRIIYLLQYNLFVASVALLYPLSNSFVQLLLRYVALECKVLYKKEFYTPQYENEVQQRVYRLLMSIYYAYFESRLVPSSRIYKECSKSIIGLFIKLKTDYGVNNKLIENIIVGLLRRTGDLDKVIALKGTRQPCSSDSYLDNANLVNVCGDVITNGYGSDDIICSSPTHNDIQLCSTDDRERESRNSSKNRVVPTICIDDDDVETVYFERECKPSERTIRKLAEKSSSDVKVEKVFSLHKPLVENVTVIKNECKQVDIYEKPYTSYRTSVEKIVQTSDEIIVIDEENHSTVNENVAQVSNISDCDQDFSSHDLRSAPIGDNKTSNRAQFHMRQSVKIEELDEQYSSKDANVNFQQKCESVNTYNIDLTVDDDEDDVIEFFRAEKIVLKAEVNDTVNKRSPRDEYDDVIPVPSVPNHCVVDLTEDDEYNNVPLMNETSSSTSNTKLITGVTNLPARIREIVDSEGISNRTTASSNSHNYKCEDGAAKLLPGVQEINNYSTCSNLRKELSCDDSIVTTNPSSTDFQIEIIEKVLDKTEELESTNVLDKENGTYFRKVSNEVGHLSMNTTKTVELEQSSNATNTSVSNQLNSVQSIVGNYNTTPLPTNQLDTDTGYQKNSKRVVFMDETSNKTKNASDSYQVNTVNDIIKEAIVNMQELSTKESSGIQEYTQQRVDNLGINNYCLATSSPIDQKKITASDSHNNITDIHEEIQAAPYKKDAVEDKEGTKILYFNTRQSNTVDCYHEDNIKAVSVVEQREQPIFNLGLNTDCSTSSKSPQQDKNKECFFRSDSQIDIRHVYEDVRVVPGGIEDSDVSQKSSNNHQVEVVEDIIDVAGIIDHKKYDTQVEASPLICELQDAGAIENNCLSSNSKYEDEDMYCSHKSKDKSASTSSTNNMSPADSNIENSNFDEEAEAVPIKEDATNEEKSTADVVEEIDKTTSSAEEISSIIQVNVDNNVIEEVGNIGDKNKDMTSSNTSGKMTCIIEKYVDCSNTNNMPSTKNHMNLTDTVGDVKTVPNEEVAVVGEKDAAGVRQAIEDTDLPLKSKKKSNFTPRPDLVNESEGTPSSEKIYSNSDQDENITGNKKDDMVCLKEVPNENDRLVHEQTKESSDVLPENAKEVTNAAKNEESDGTPITNVSSDNCQINAVDANLHDESVNINEKDDDFDGRLPIICPFSPEQNPNLESEIKTNISSPVYSALISTTGSEADTEETEDIPKILNYSNSIADKTRVDVNTNNDNAAKVPFAVEESKPNQSFDCEIRNDCNTTIVSNIPEGNVYPDEFQVGASNIPDELRVVEDNEVPFSMEIKWDAVETGVIADIHKPTKAEFADVRDDIVLEPSREEATDLISETKRSEESTDWSQEVKTTFVEMSTIPESSSVTIHNELCPTVVECNSALNLSNDDSKIVEETSDVIEVTFENSQIDVGEAEVITFGPLTVAEEVVGDTEIPTDEDKTMTLSADVYSESAPAGVSSGENEDLPLTTSDKKKEATTLAEPRKAVICKELIVKLEQLNIVTIKNRDDSYTIQDRSTDEDSVGIDDNIVVTGFQNLLSEIKVDESSPVLGESSEIVKNQNQDSVNVTTLEDNLNTHEDNTDETEVMEDKVYDVYNEDTLSEPFNWCYMIKIQASNSQTKTSTSQYSGDAVFRPLRTMAERKLYYELNPEFVNENCSDIQIANQSNVKSKRLDNNSMRIQSLKDDKQEDLLKAGEKSAFTETISKMHVSELEKQRNIGHTKHSKKSVTNENNFLLKVDEVSPKPTEKPSICPSKSNEKPNETKSSVIFSESKIKCRNVSENNSKKEEGSPDEVSKISGIKTNQKTSKSRESSSVDRSHKSRPSCSDKERKSKSNFVNEVSTTKITTARSDTEQLGIAKPANALGDKIVKSSGLELGHVKNISVDKSKSTSSKISSGYTSNIIDGSIDVLSKLENMKHRIELIKHRKHSKKSSRSRSRSSDKRSSSSSEVRSEKYHSKTNHDKSVSGSERAEKDNRDKSLKVYKDKKYLVSGHKDKEAFSKKNLKEKYRHIDSKTRSEPSSVVDSNVVSVESPSKVNITSDSIVKMKVPKVSATLSPQTQLGSNLRSSDVTALNTIAKENKKLRSMDSHAPKPEDNMKEKSDKKTNNIYIDQKINTSTLASEVKVFEDCPLNHKSLELPLKQDLVASIDVIEESVLNSNSNNEEVCSSNMSQKQNVSNYIDVIVNLDEPVCQTHPKTQEVDNLTKNDVNGRDISKNTHEDGKSEENLQIATKTICTLQDSVLEKKVGDVVTEGMDKDETSRKNLQKTDETTKSGSTISADSSVSITSELETNKAADVGVDKSQLTVSSVVNTSPLDLPSHFGNCDKKCFENPESSRIELDSSKVETSLYTLTENNETSNVNIDKENGMYKKRKMDVSDSTTVKRVKSEGERASSKKLETSMESIINEMKENVSISQTENIDVSAMKRKLTEKIYNKPIPELIIDLPEPVLVPPADFDIFDAETDSTRPIKEQPSSCTDLHDVSVGAALDQISFLNNSLDASAIESNILEKVKFIDDLEPHNVSDYAHYTDEAQPLKQDTDATSTTNRENALDETNASSTIGVTEHAIQSSTVNFGDLTNITLSSEDIGILSKIITTMSPIDTCLTAKTTSTAVNNVSRHEQIETSESWAIIDANLSSSFPDISPMKMFIDRNALTISSDNGLSGTSLIDKNISVTPSLPATGCSSRNGCTPPTMERDHGDINDHNYYAGARGLLECSKTTDNCNVSVDTSNSPNDSVDDAPKMDTSKDFNDSAENAPEENNSAKRPKDLTGNVQEIDSPLMSGVKSESGSMQKINIDNEYAIKNLVSLSQSSSDSNDFLPPNSSEVDFFFGLLDNIYVVGDIENKDAKCDVHWDHLMADEEPPHEVPNEEGPIEKAVELDKAADVVTVGAIKVAEEGTVDEEREIVSKSPVVVSSTPVEPPKDEIVPKKTKLLILPSGRSPVLAPPKKKTCYHGDRTQKLDVKTKKPLADCTGDNLILLPTMPPIESEKPKPVTTPASVIPKGTKIVEDKQTSVVKNAGGSPTMPPIISDNLPSNESIRKDRTVNVTNTTTSLQRPAAMLNIFDKIKLEKRAACSRKSPTPADVRNPDNPTTKRTSPNTKMRFQEIKTSEKYISPELVAKEHPVTQDKRDNYIIINTDNLLKLKLRPVHRSFQSHRTDDGHNLKRKSPVSGEPTTKLRRVGVVNGDNVFDETLEVAPRLVHRKRETYGDKYQSGKQATQYRNGLSSSGFKVTYHSQDKWYEDKKTNSYDGANSRLEVKRLDTDSALPKRKLSSEEISGASSSYQTHRLAGRNTTTILKRRPHDNPLPTSRLFFPSSSSNVLRTYSKPGVSHRPHLSEDL